MGTIIPRKRKDGSTGFQAQLLVKRSSKIVHRESRTFDRKQAASAWLEKREKELAKPGSLERVNALDPILAWAICRDYFSHLTPTKLMRKISAGEIAIPLVRIEPSQKCAKGVHLSDLAKYLDARAEAARERRSASPANLAQLSR